MGVDWSEEKGLRVVEMVDQVGTIMEVVTDR